MEAEDQAANVKEQAIKDTQVSMSLYLSTHQYQGGCSANNSSPYKYRL